ncbi:hypothetical protein [Halopseudomonas sp.]|uniref:hypothetical protein n=1 Tax=Halopseudomonas sp. TaxID=2901191 RepID=UPI0030029995
MKSWQGSDGSMLNKYIDRLEQLIGIYRETELAQFEAPGGAKADFDDRIWYHIDPNNGRRTRYLCGSHGRKGRGNAGNDASDVLSYPYNHLIKIWIITTANTSFSASQKKSRAEIARKLLTLMDGHLYAQSEATIRSLSLGEKAADRLRPFLAFCAEKGIMRALSYKEIENRNRTSHAHLDAVAEKLPSIDAVIALGSIFSSVFEHVDANGYVSHGEEVKMHDALVLTFALLSLASPNRMSAEIPVLPKQRLGSYSESEGEPVYYLDWIGSKGYGHNRNHLLAALAEPLTKAVNFFYEACEPGRILCRFYENPDQSLEMLLGGFEVGPELKKNLSLSEKPNLFTLGYALGFYAVAGFVPVLHKGADPAHFNNMQKGKLFFEKPIYSLASQDRLSLSTVGKTKFSALPYLFGYTELPKIFGDEEALTIAEIQKRWITFYRKSILPEFPLAYSTGESNIKLKDAMFCFLGSSFYRGLAGNGGRLLQRSKYAVVPLASLGPSVISRLTPHSVVKETIFQNYGFSAELGLLPHSLRHFSNTLADLSRIPVEIITAWSGRKNPEQTHTYVHSGHEEKAGRVSAIINPPDVDKKLIRTISNTRLIEVTNLPASLTSTGLCTQNLNVTPCNYLNDFVSQCFMCPETCHVGGDEKAIEFFEKDLSFQSKRLDSVTSDTRLSTSTAMKAWYIVHFRNVHILSALIGLMKESPIGTIIQYSNTKCEFRLTDLETMALTRVAPELPKPEDRLAAVIESRVARPTADANPQLRSLLTSFGLSGEEM